MSDVLRRTTGTLAVGVAPQTAGRYDVIATDVIAADVTADDVTTGACDAIGRMSSPAGEMAVTSDEPVNPADADISKLVPGTPTVAGLLTEPDDWKLAGGWDVSDARPRDKTMKPVRCGSSQSGISRSDASLTTGS